MHSKCHIVRSTCVLLGYGLGRKDLLMIGRFVERKRQDKKTFLTLRIHFVIQNYFCFQCDNETMFSQFDMYC